MKKHFNVQQEEQMEKLEKKPGHQKKAYLFKALGQKAAWVTSGGTGAAVSPLQY